MRSLLLCFMASTAMLVWACSSETAPDEGGGGACTAADPNTEGFCRGPMQCGTPDTTCTCAATFVCTNGAPPGPGFPSAPPKAGDCCTVEGLLCGGWDTCAPICRCEQGKWSCEDPPCPVFFCPDPVTKLLNERCDDRIGDVCTGNDENGCTPLCDCQLDPGVGGAVWVCGESCGPDAGSLADGG